LSHTRYHLWVSGCQMNGSDARWLADALDASGMSSVDQFEDADVAVLYTCSVRQSAEDRVHGQLGHLKSIKAQKPGMLLCVTGCMAGADPSELKRRYPFVDLFVSPTEMQDLPSRLMVAAEEDASCLPPTPAYAHRVPVSVGVTVIRGCDKYCSYCIVPYRRGRQQSRRTEEIVEEAAGLLSRGAREIVLLGQTVDAWGRDLEPQSSLARLMEELAALPDLYRMRFLTSHPNDFTDDLLEALASLPQLCEDLNLPVQAGDDELLRHMGRPYTVAQYLELVDRIRKAVPAIGLSTDLIVGFPGETEAQFQHSLDLMRRVEFDTVHIAAYSPRPGTAAARKMVDDVPAEDKKRRLHEVELLQTEIAARKNALMEGSAVEVLVERRSKGKWCGRTRSNRLVFFESDLKLRGQLVEVMVDGSGPWSLRGVLQSSTTLPD
jgi:tRNA-2-methylthio-N6-dimethylallyladenosine synthase